MTEHDLRQESLQTPLHDLLRRLESIPREIESERRAKLAPNDEFRDLAVAPNRRDEATFGD